MTLARDYLDGVKPKSTYFSLVSAKRILLNNLLRDVERETIVEYPPTFLYYPMITEGDGIVRGTIQAQEVVGRKGLVEHVVYISGFTLLSFDEKTILGVLVEEFLHYAYRSRIGFVTKRIPKLEDKLMLEPLDDWFKDPRFRDAFEAAQTPARPGEWRRNLEDWRRRGFPERDISALPGYVFGSKLVDLSQPSDIIKALIDKGIVS